MSEQRSLIPQGARKAAALLGAFAALCTAAWFALVRPVVTSIAT